MNKVLCMANAVSVFNYLCQEYEGCICSITRYNYWVEVTLSIKRGMYDSAQVKRDISRCCMEGSEIRVVYSPESEKDIFVVEWSWRSSESDPEK